MCDNTELWLNKTTPHLTLRYRYHTEHHDAAHLHDITSRHLTQPLPYYAIQNATPPCCTDTKHHSASRNKTRLDHYYASRHDTILHLTAPCRTNTSLHYTATIPHNTPLRAANTTCDTLDNTRPHYTLPHKTYIWQHRAKQDSTSTLLYFMMHHLYETQPHEQHLSVILFRWQQVFRWQHSLCNQLVDQLLEFHLLLLSSCFTSLTNPCFEMSNVKTFMHLCH